MIFFLPMVAGSLAALFLASEQELGRFWRFLAVALGVSALAFQWLTPLRGQVHWLVPLFEQVFLVIWATFYQKTRGL